MASATGFGFLASNQGITGTPQHHTCTHRPAPPWPRRPHHTRRLERPSWKDKGRASPGGKGRAGSQASLSSCQKPPKPTRQPGHSCISPGGRAQHPAGTRSHGLCLGSPAGTSGWQRMPGPSRAQQDGDQDQRAIWCLTAQAPPGQKRDGAGRRRPHRGCAPPPFLTRRLQHTRVPARLTVHTRSIRCLARSRHCSGVWKMSVPQVPIQASSSPMSGHVAFSSDPQRVSARPRPLCCNGRASPSPLKAHMGSSMQRPRLRLWGPAP